MWRKLTLPTGQHLPLECQDLSEPCPGWAPTPPKHKLCTVLARAHATRKVTI